MSFNSISFLIFLTIGLCIYRISPDKCRNVVLLLISYAFYGLYNWKVLLFLIGFSLINYFFGRILEQKKNKVLLYGAVITALLPLLLCKYTSWSIVLPLGISYFTFKSVGYLADVYKGKINAEKNIILLCSFISFLPEMLIGPIDRAKDLIPQLREGRKPDVKEMEVGIFLLLGGYFEKMVVADRLGIIVNQVYGDLNAYGGIVIFLAIVAYSLQIYFDFAGCTYMALGVGRIFGFYLPENFRQPYLAVSVEDFWHRWHLSLTSWLRDYVYIPLGGNRKGVVRKYFNVMAVFFVSGIWHGAGLNFIIWGALNGLFQIIGTMLRKTKSKLYKICSIEESSKICIWWKRCWTFLWMTIAWVFFRSQSVGEAIFVFKRLFSSWNPWVLSDGTLYELGLSSKNVTLLLLMLILMAIIEVLHERKISLSKWVVEQNFIVKCVISYITIFAVIIFGIYGTTYDAGSFIYMQF